MHAGMANTISVIAAFLPSKRPCRPNLLGIAPSTRSATWSVVDPQDPIHPTTRPGRPQPLPPPPPDKTGAFHGLDTRPSCAAAAADSPASARLRKPAARPSHGCVGRVAEARRGKPMPDACLGTGSRSAPTAFASTLLAIAPNSSVRAGVTPRSAGLPDSFPETIRPAPWPLTGACSAAPPWRTADGAHCCQQVRAPQPSSPRGR